MLSMKNSTEKTSKLTLRKLQQGLKLPYIDHLIRSLEAKTYASTDQINLNEIMHSIVSWVEATEFTNKAKIKAKFFMLMTRIHSSGLFNIQFLKKKPITIKWIFFLSKSVIYYPGIRKLYTNTKIGSKFVQVKVREYPSH